MANWNIISSAGADMGTFEGETPRAAIEAMWADAGWTPKMASEADAAAAELTVREVASAINGFATVIDYHTDRTLDGDASDELVSESAKAGPTGAVPAYCEAGWWHYVQPSQVERMRRLGHEVRTVYVDR